LHRQVEWLLTFQDALLPPTFQQQYNWLVSVSMISLIITVDKIIQTMR